MIMRSSQNKGREGGKGGEAGKGGEVGEKVEEEEKEVFIYQLQDC